MHARVWIVLGGDCLVFGGRSRGIVHGVRRIMEGTCPDYLSDLMPANCRLNLSLRQYAWAKEHDEHQAVQYAEEKADAVDIEVR